MSDIVEEIEEWSSWDDFEDTIDMHKRAITEIERLRAALRAIAACDARDDMDVAMEIAKEALGDA